MNTDNHCAVCHFRYNPKSLLLDTPYWRVDLNDNQAYLGRSIISLKRHAGSLSELTPQEWLELKELINRIELALKGLFNATAFNWTALMNDAYKAVSPQPHVHFHVWPRYREAATINGVIFNDPNFAHHYNKTMVRKVTGEILEAIHDKITEALKQRVQL